MAKNKLLDAGYKAAGLILLTLLLSSCGLPKIIVLKDPLTPEEHLNLGLSYESRGEYLPAIEQYDMASKELPLAFLYIGNLYFIKGEYEKAEAAYGKAISKTGNPEAYNNLAWLYYTTGREMKKAEELAEKAVSLSPESADFRDTLDKIRKKVAEATK
ncbi:MAG: tetratricopeptide repeat protein [Nitrospirae bacterium]|nr:tetratricopeptide repeat protein [Nitrospirota bacterium]